MTQVKTLEFPTANGAYRAGRIAFVHALWHAEIVREAYTGFVDEMASLGIPPEAIEKFETPGSFEIPLHAQTLARTGRYAAIVAAGFVVDGGIYRHDFVAGTVLDGMMRVQLETGVPVLSTVLTPHNFQESEAHIRFFRDHFVVKGVEAANACSQILQARAQLALVNA
jgi:6,7-dimethyl-8-ribityllumazine synthase